MTDRYKNGFINARVIIKSSHGKQGDIEIAVYLT